MPSASSETSHRGGAYRSIEIGTCNEPVCGEYLLLRELMHRMNNELAATIGFANLSAARSGSDDVKMALAGVIQQVTDSARVYRALQMPVDDGWMDAAAYLRELCQSISRAKLQHRGIELVLVECPLQLNASRCWRLGMIVSELIANASRHAFRDGSGKIQVELINRETSVECIVMDDGSGSEKIRPGQGMKIIRSLVAELRGTINHRSGTKGTSAILAFPLSELERTDPETRPLNFTYVPPKINGDTGRKNASRIVQRSHGHKSIQSVQHQTVEKNMKILMVITSHDQLGNTGRKTGFWLEELAAPYYVFKDAGAEITLASPKGGRPPLDPKSNEPDMRTDLTLRFEKDAAAELQLDKTVHLDSVRQEDFDTVFYPGGHGPMWDLAEDKNSAKLIESFLAAGKPIGIVCHSTGALRHVKTPDGKPLVQGKEVTGFTNGEEEEIGLTRVVPFLVEDEMLRLGAIFSKKANWAVHVVSDGLLITGQNPHSSGPAAKTLMAALKQKASPAAARA